jgi:hypothetical protein
MDATRDACYSSFPQHKTGAEELFPMEGASMKGTIRILALSLLLLTACAPRLVRGSPQSCTRQFLYTEYATGRGGTLETRPVYGCAVTAQPVNAGKPAGSRS